MTSVDAEVNSSKYKWYVLTLAALTFTFVIAIPTMCMPVLFEEISEELGLNLVEIGMVWGMAPLAGVFIVLIGGLLSDRFGVKRVLIVTCLLAGLAGALRGLSNDFITLTATMFLFGLLTAILPPCVHKTCGVWFPRKQLGLANGFVSMGMAVGFMIGAMTSATILSPLLGGWRNVLILYGAISIVMSILWYLTKSEPGDIELRASHASTTQFRQSLSQIVRIRRVWVLGFILLGQIGCVRGTLGYLPLYLRKIGWSTYSADGALALFHGVSMMGAIPVALLSDRLLSRKKVLFLSTILTGIGVGLLSIANGPMVWASVIIAGIARDGFMAVIMTTVIETPGVGAIYAGTALGLVQTFSRLGTFASPPIGNSLADIRLSLPFVFWAALAALALVAFIFIKDERQRGEIENSKDQ